MARFEPTVILCGWIAAVDAAGGGRLVAWNSVTLRPDVTHRVGGLSAGGGFSAE
jgi:hypothetical protein